MGKAIVITSFGTCDEDGRHCCLDSIVEDFRKNFPSYDITQAFTSEYIRRQLNREGVSIDSLTKALQRLSRDGYDQVYIQPTHLTPGEEYDNKIVAVAEKFAASFSQLIIGEPVFFHDADYAKGAAAVLQAYHCQPEEVLVLLGHGSPHRHNPVYERLQRSFDAMDGRVYVGVLEESDTPNFAAVLAELQRDKCKQVLLAPLLLSGSNHIVKDLAGDQPFSWKKRLENAGYRVRICREALGCFPEFRKLYLDKAAARLGK